MAIAYRGNGTTVYWNNSSATQNVANPSGTVAGDLLIMVWTYYASFGTGGTLSNPSGWTLDHTITGAGSPVPSFKLFHRIADLSGLDDPSLVPSAGMYGAVAKFAISDVDQFAPIHTDATPVNSFASGTVVGPALTATRAQMGLSIAVHAAGSGFPWTSPSPGTEQLNNEGNYGSFQVVSQTGTSGDLGTVTHNETFATVTRIVFGLLIEETIPVFEAEPQELTFGVEVPHREPLLNEPFDDFSNWTTSGSPTPAIVSGLDGTAARLQNSGGNTGIAAYTIPSINESATVVVGCYYQVDDFSADPHIFEFRSDAGSTFHCHVNARSDGSVGFLVGGGLINFSSAGVLVVNTWAYIEARVRLGDSPNGTYDVHVNGTSVISGFTSDTKNGGTKSVFDEIRLTTHTLGTITSLYDVLYIDTGTNAPFLGQTSATDASGGANTTPSAIARSVVVPAPTASGGGAGDGTATPSAIARVVTTPAPTTTGNANTSPTAIARSVVAPAPTATGTSSTAFPSAIALTVVTPAPTATGEQGTATPATIARTVTVPTPSASGSHVFPAAIARTVTVPTPFVTGTFPAGTYIPVGRVRLFDRTGTTLVATLESAFDIEWQDVDNGTGIGKFNLALNDPDSLLITLGQVVYCDLYDRSNVFSFIVEQYPQARIQSQEELGQVMSISGRGSAAILDTALCYPFDGVNAVPVRTVRSFSFASQDYVETVDWHGATAIAQQGDMTTYWVMTMPETTHLMSAPGAWPNLPIIPYWIWSQDDNSEIGKSYFRETFTTAEAANIEIIATGDNYWTLYLDGVPILGDNEFQEAWQEHRSVSMLLPAGDHTVAAVVNNVFVPLIVGNPGGFLMAILIPHEGQEVDPDLMLLSDTGWNALAYPAAEPGFTPGGIVLSLLTEAQGRSLLTAVTCSFTATHDSAGIAWETIPEFGVNIGASLLTTLESLTSDGWIEWAMTPNGWVLQMWAPGNRGVAAGVTFTEAINIGEATYEPAHTIVNRLLVSYGKGLFVSEPASALASQAVWGIHEGFLTLDTDDASEASRLALKSIATSMDDELAVTMRIEPDGASPDRPYVNFVVGDQVTGPNELGVARSYQVLGITITLDLMGDPEISLEMNRRVRNPEEVRVNLLQTLGSAVQGTAPGSRSVVFENDGPYYRTRTPTAGDVKAAGPPAPGEVVFTVPGVVDLTGTSPRWVTPYRFLIYQVIMAVTTVSSGEGGITVRVLGQDFTLPDGQESILIDCELHRDNANSFTVALTDVGGGDATGLTVTLRYRYYTGAL